MRSISLNIHLQVFASDLAQEQHKFLIDMEEGFEKLLLGSVSSKQASNSSSLTCVARACSPAPVTGILFLSLDVLRFVTSQSSPGGKGGSMDMSNACTREVFT